MILATLLVKNEEEIIEDCILHHLNNGVDKFIITDNDSTDNTKTIASKFKEVVRIINEPEDNYQQGKWVTRMAKIATNYKPDWVVHIDADEFWYGLKNVYKIPKNIGAAWLPPHYYEHLISKELKKGEFKRELMPFCKRIKSSGRLVHRPHRDVQITQGNHMVLNHPGQKKYIIGDYVVMHHYSNRYYEQFEEKTIQGGRAYEKYPGDSGDGSHWRKHYISWQEGTLKDFYDKELFLTEEKIKEGLLNGNIYKFVKPTSSIL